MLTEIYLFPFICHLNGLRKSMDFNFESISYSRFLDAETETGIFPRAMSTIWREFRIFFD